MQNHGTPETSELTKVGVDLSLTGHIAGDVGVTQSVVLCRVKLSQ